MERVDGLPRFPDRRGRLKRGAGNRDAQDEYQAEGDPASRTSHAASSSLRIHAGADIRCRS